MIEPAREGETVDQMCWRIFARTDGITEQVLDLNPGLADRGPRLAAGTLVTLPEPDRVGPPLRETINLWD